MMLRVIKDDIKKNYYDPAYHGIDLEARFKLAEDKMLEAKDVGMLLPDAHATPRSSSGGVE